MMNLTTEQITKLKVAEIKEQLKQRGLDQTGTKGLLIARLIASVDNEAKAEEEVPKAKAEESVTERAPEPAPVDATPTEESPKENDTEKAPEEDGEIKPKHTPIVYNIPQKDTESMKADEEAKKKRRAERFGIVDEAEREAKKLKSRTERFGLKLAESDSAKLEQRAKRFAQSSGQSGGNKDSRGIIDLSGIVTSATVTEDEKKRRRAERFGTPAKN